MRNIDGTIGSDILPPDDRWELRGNTWFDPITGSSTQIAVGYCKDLSRCGVRDYRQVGAALNLNYLDSCIPKLNGVLSIKGLFFESASVDNISTMLQTLQLNGEGRARFNETASVICPGDNT